MSAAKAENPATRTPHKRSAYQFEDSLLGEPHADQSVLRRKEPRLYRPLLVGTFWSLGIALFVTGLNLALTVFSQNVVGYEQMPAAFSFWTPCVAVMIGAAQLSVFSAAPIEKLLLHSLSYIAFSLLLQVFMFADYSALENFCYSLLLVVPLAWIPAGAALVALIVFWLWGHFLAPPTPSVENRLSIKSLLAYTLIGALLCGASRAYVSASPSENAAYEIAFGFGWGVIMGLGSILVMLVIFQGKRLLLFPLFSLVGLGLAAPYVAGALIPNWEFEFGITLNFLFLITAAQVFGMAILFRLEGFEFTQIPTQETSA